MRLALAALAGVLAATLPAAAGSAAPPHANPPASPPTELVIFGYVKSLVRTGARYELRVDPAEYLSGETANRAAIDDGVIPAGDVVPNDHYIRNESHKLLTYFVAAGIPVTVVANGVHALRITVADLAQIVKGKNPKHLPLMEPKNGFWIRVATDGVRRLDQQYSP